MPLDFCSIDDGVRTQRRDLKNIYKNDDLDELIV